MITLCKAVNPLISLAERTILGIGGAVFNLRNSKSLLTAAECISFIKFWK